MPPGKMQMIVSSPTFVANSSAILYMDSSKDLLWMPNNLFTVRLHLCSAYPPN